MNYGKNARDYFYAVLRIFLFFSSTRQNIAIPWRRCIKYGGSRVRVRAKTDDMVRIYFVLCTLYFVRLRSKRFRLVSEQRKADERDFCSFTRAVASMRQDQAVASSWFWPFFLSFFLFFFWRNFSSLKRLKTWSRTSMVNARLNGLALAYIHKPTEIDGSSV